MATIRIDLIGKDNASSQIKSVTTSLTALSGKAKTLAIAFQDPALNKDTFSNILMNQAKAADLSNNKVLALAQSTGFYTQAQTQNAMATANATAFAEKLTKQLARGKITADEAGKQYKAYTDTLTTSIPVTQNFVSTLTQLGAQVAIVAGVGMAIKKVIDYVYNLAEAGAGLTRLQDSFVNLATIGGESSDRLLTAMRNASMGAISDADLIATANKAMLLGVTANAEQMATLLQIATIRGRAMGISTTQAFDDMARGIGRASPLILDNLGIIVDARKNYKEYGDMIGVAGNQLNKAQKSQALLTAVVRDGNRLLKESNGIAEDTAISYERLGAGWANYSNALKKSLGESLEPLVRTLATVLNYMAQLQNAGAGKGSAWWTHLFPPAAAVMDIIATVKAIRGVQDQAATAKTVIDQMGDSYNEADVAAKQYTMTLEEQEAAFEAQSDRYKTLLDTMTAIGSENKDFVTTQSELAGKIRETEGKLNDLIERGWKPNQQKVKDVKADLEELKAQYEANAQAHREATNKILYDLLMQKLAVGGLTTEEYNIAVAAGEAFGIFDKKAAETALKMGELTDAVLSGKASVLDLKGAMDLITSKSVTVDVAIVTTQETRVARSKPPKVEAKAAGGPVWQNRPYWVGDGGEPELFVPNQSGTIVPQHKLEGGSFGGSIVNNVFNISGADPKAVAREIGRTLKLQGVQGL